MALSPNAISADHDLRPAELSGGPLLNDNSIFWYLEKGFQMDPDVPAVICMGQPARHLSRLLGKDGTSDDAASPGTNHLVITFKQLLAMAQRLVAGWTLHGLKVGSTVLICIANGGEFCVLFWACILMRLTVVCMDPSILAAASYRDLRHAIRTLKPSLIVISDCVNAVAVDIAIQELRISQPLRILLDDDCSNIMWRPLSAFAEADLSVEEVRTLLDQARNDDAERIHSILFTSGTSGRPKGCPLRVAGQTHFLRSWSWLLNRHNSSRALQQAHNSRAIAPTQMLQTWSTGGTVLLPSRSFHLDDTITAIETFGATFVVLSPAMVHAIADRIQLSRDSGINLSSVTTVQIGGDAVNRTVLLKCAALFPDARICTHHGMSEGVAAFQWPFFDVLASKIPFLGETCPTGTVAPGTTVRLWNADQLRISRRNEPGEMHIQSRSVIQHYLGGASASSFYDDAEGRWFITGDTATMDSNGIVYILGRSKDVIRRAGVAVMPGPLESLIQHFVGAQTCVVGVPDAGLTETACAVVKDMNGKTEEEIIRNVEQNLGEQYALDRVLALKGLGLTDFPVNQTFKIVRSSVQEAVFRHLNIRCKSDV